MNTIAKEHAAFDPLLTAPEAAKYLGMNPETLIAMARRREIACVRQSTKKGSPTKFRLSAINQWIHRHEISPLRHT